MPPLAKGRVGGHQFQRRYFRCAKRDRRIRLQLRDDAKPLRCRDDGPPDASWVRRTATVFSDRASACVSVTGQNIRATKFDGRQPS